MNVTLRQLRAFIAVARAGSVTEAALRLHITQSALSGLIKDLESNLGVQMLHRTTRKLQLSGAGEVFLPMAERILQDLGMALDAVSDLRELRTGTVRIAVPQVMACTVMPEIMAAFARKYPGIRVRLQDSMVESVLGRLTSGDVDLAIGPERDASAHVVARALFTLPFLAVLPPGHPLTQKQRVAWSDLVRYPVISLQGEYTQLLSAELYASPGRIEFSPTHEVAFLTTALSMVEHGLGVTTCLPYAGVLLQRQKLEFRPLVTPVLSRRFQVWLNKDRGLSPSAQEFLDFLMQYVEDNPAPEVRAFRKAG
ncbi:LysR family transcriptional regulator [Acidovorax cavernicola]|uniref:LysR family transcriptional regulator n=1 Tax=Acidovorax cavernicola TaxID=1675792 RepID=A0A9X8D936_9BURK|nr:LysR family transcriptional regulator [Acidovorax cavernicola]RIX85030.1 LysR family transcriptional regulator [Acidovorax cavernicola]